MKHELKQQAIFVGSGVIFRTVRQIQEWDGRTVGIVRNGRGAEFIVQRTAHRWDVLSGVSVQDIRKT